MTASAPTPTGQLGYLVDGTILLSTRPDPDADDVTIDCLLLAQRDSPEASALDRWAQEYVGVLANLGWSPTLSTNHNLEYPVAKGRPPTRRVVPWTLIRQAMAAAVPASVLSQLDAVVAGIPPASVNQSRRWQEMTILDRSTAAAAVAVLCRTAEGCQLVLTTSSIVCSEANPPLSAYPTQAVLFNGLKFTSETSEFLLPADSVAPLLAQLEPLVTEARPQVAELPVNIQ